MTITIDPSITESLPDFNIIPLIMDVTVESSAKIAGLIANYEQKIAEEYSLEDVLNIPLIKEARESYKKLGKDPSRYRLAVESLYRRIVKGNSLYQINNVVDAGNILSLATMRSTAVMDFEKIQGDVLIRKGTEADYYIGIGRGKLNVSNIPVYVDEIGPFGSTTSDTPRTQIGLETKRIFLMIICFSNLRLEEHRNLAISLFQKYANGENIITVDVKKASGKD
jgi:DNA/RNA-binding domain of Phe-tRNA-synthetase-like protein